MEDLANSKLMSSLGWVLIEQRMGFLKWGCGALNLVIWGDPTVVQMQVMDTIRGWTIVSAKFNNSFASYAHESIGRTAKVFGTPLTKL